MAKVKFTPFVLFLILLVVLVISVLFGYKNKIFEGSTTYYRQSYQEITTVDNKKISVNKFTGNILIEDKVSGVETSFNSTGAFDSNGEEAPETEATETEAFVINEGDLIIPYIKYADDIYLLIITKNKLVAYYIYAQGTPNIGKNLTIPMTLNNYTRPSSFPESSDDTIKYMASDIELDIGGKRFKKSTATAWTEIRTDTGIPRVLESTDGSCVISMEGTRSTSNYIVFSLYKENQSVNIENLILSYKEASKSRGSGVDTSKFIPKTWLNLDGCPKCQSKGDCSMCKSTSGPGTPGPVSGTPGPVSGTSGPGSGTSRPGSGSTVDPKFGNNLVDKTTGVANNAIGGATALGLGAALGATVLGATAVGAASKVAGEGIGGATSLGNNAIRGASSLGNNAIGGASSLGNNAIGGATKLGQGVTNAAGQAVGSAGGVLNNTVDKLTGLAGGLGSGAKDLLKSGQRQIGVQGQGVQSQGVQGQGVQGQGVQGQGVQSQGVQGQGQLVGQPPGQQYAGYQFAFPATNCGPLMMNPIVPTSNFRDFSANADMGTKGNYFS